MWSKSLPEDAPRRSWEGKRLSETLGHGHHVLFPKEKEAFPGVIHPHCRTAGAENVGVPRRHWGQASMLWLHLSCLLNTQMKLSMDKYRN